TFDGSGSYSCFEPSGIFFLDDGSPDRRIQAGMSLSCFIRRFLPCCRNRSVPDPRWGRSGRSIQTSWAGRDLRYLGAPRPPTPLNEALVTADGLPVQLPLNAVNAIWDTDWS